MGVRNVRVERSAQGVRVTVPGGHRKSAGLWGAIMFGSWILISLSGIVPMVLLGSYQADVAPPSFLFLILPLITLSFGILGAYLLAWSIGGTESVRRTPDSLVVQKRLFGVPVSSSHYDIRYVERMRYSPLPYMGRWNLWAALLGASVAFDYGALTARFGIGQDEQQATDLLHAVGDAQ